MPHIQIDYSPNLADRLDIPKLCQVLRDAAVETGILPLAGIRVRATAASYVVIADGDPQHAYLDISIRLRAGRSKDAKVKATSTIFATAEAFCSEALQTSSFMLSMEMRDIDPDLAPKSSSIRNYLPEDDQ